MPDYAALVAAWGVGGSALAYALFKWILPYLGKAFAVVFNKTSAEGDIVLTLQAERDRANAERDKYKTDAETANAGLRDMQLKYAKMAGYIQLMRYQLYEARVKIATLTGEPPPPAPAEDANV